MEVVSFQKKPHSPMQHNLWVLRGTKWNRFYPLLEGRYLKQAQDYQHFGNQVCPLQQKWAKDSGLLILTKHVFTAGTPLVGGLSQSHEN